MSFFKLLNCIGIIKNCNSLFLRYHSFTRDTQTILVFSYDNELIFLNLHSNQKQICQGHLHYIHHTFHINNSFYSLDSHKMIKWDSNGNALQEFNILANTFYLYISEDCSITILASYSNNGTLFYNFDEELLQLDFEADEVECNATSILACKIARLTFYDSIKNEFYCKNFRSKIVASHLCSDTVFIVVLESGNIIKYEYQNEQLLKCFDLHFNPTSNVVIKDGFIYFFYNMKCLKVDMDFKLVDTFSIPNIKNISALVYDDDQYLEYIFCTDNSLNRFVKVENNKNVSVTLISPILNTIRKCITFKDELLIIDLDRCYYFKEDVLAVVNGNCVDAISLGDDLLLQQDNQTLALNEIKLSINEEICFGGYNTKEFSIISKTKICVIDKAFNTLAIINCKNVLKTVLHHNRVYILRKNSLEWQSYMEIDLQQKILFKRYDAIDFEIFNGQIYLITGNSSVIRVLDADSLIHLQQNEFLHSNGLTCRFVPNRDYCMAYYSNKISFIQWNSINQSCEIRLSCSGSILLCVSPTILGFKSVSPNSIKVWKVDLNEHFSIVESTKQDLIFFRIVQLKDKPMLQHPQLKETLNLQQLKDFLCLKGIALTSDEYNELIMEIQVRSSSNHDFKLNLKQCLAYCIIYKENKVVQPTILDESLTEIGDAITMDELLQYQQE